MSATEKMGQTPPPDELKVALAGGDDKRQRWALWFLAYAAGAEYLPFLQEMTGAENGTAYAPFAAGAGIARLEGIGQVGALVERLAARFTPDVADETPLALEYFTDALYGVDGEDAEYRLSANVPAIQRELTGLLAHERGAVRAFALYLLSLARPTESAPLVRALRDSDSTVREIAAIAAPFYFTSEVTQALTEALADGDEWVRIRACHALRHRQVRGDARKEVIEALKRVEQEDASERVRAAAKSARRWVDGTNDRVGFAIMIGLILACGLLAQLFR